MDYDSVIINFIAVVFRKAQNVYYNSVTAAVIKGIAQWVKEAVSYSVVWRFFKKDSFLTKAWGHSIICRAAAWIPDVSARLLGRLYRKLEYSFSQSCVSKLLKLLLDNFDIVLGASLAFMVIVPDQRWHNVYGVIMVLVLAFLFFIKTIMNQAERFNLKFLDFPLVIFIVSLALAAVTSVFPGLSVYYLVLYLISFILVILIVSSIKTGKGLERLIEVLLIGVAFTALYAVWQWKVVGVPVNPSITDIRLNPGLTRIYSTMGNENVYAGFLLLTLPLFWTVIFNSGTLLKKAVYAALFLLSLFGLYLTGSRSAWIAFAISIFVLVFFKNRKLIPFVLILGILCFPLLPESILNRIRTVANPNDNSIKTRIEIWRSAFVMLKDYWKTGVGLGADTFSTIFKRYVPLSLSGIAHTHNLYLQIWIETGIISVLAFIWFAFRTAKNCAIAIFNSTDRYVNNILIGGAAAIAGILAMGLVENVWFFSRELFITWVVVGITLAGINILSSNGKIGHQASGLSADK